jgi:hypothetical protein
MKPTRAFAVATLFALIACPARAGDLVISELMAANETTLKDEDGDFSDWIEIHNAGASAASLSGLYLTDEEINPKKWRFPAVSLGAGRFLVVFASGKDRVNPTSELHANFKLTSTGEYLALIAPDGATPLFELKPTFPPQVEDFSYGLSQHAVFTHLVVSGAPSRTLIPADGSLGAGWTQAGFDDAGWTSGATGVGYDRNPDYLPLLGTNVASQMDNINTSAYIRIPFTVTNPSAYNGLVLRMKYDDGYLAYLNGTLVASKNAPAPPAWNSAASAQHDDTLAVVFEEVNISQFVGQLRQGQNVLAIQGLNSGLTSSDFLILPELDAIDSGTLDPNVKEYFPQPTPGSPNLPGYPAVAEKPQFSKDGGVITGSFMLSLSTSSPQAIVRYTLDGSQPSPTSAPYSAPVSIAGTTMVRAKTFDGNLAPSPTVTKTYVLLAANVRAFTSDLPILILETFSQGVNDVALTPVFSAILEPGANGRSSITAAPQFSGRGGIKWRGSSSLGFPKKSFAFETWDEFGEDLKVSIFDFPKESDWILYAPYTDKTLMRDYLSYLWSNRIGRWAPSGRFVELFVNTSGGNLDSSDYQGVYLFLEKIKRGDHRVEIDKLYASDSTEPDITGGYILKKDRLDPGDSGFTTSRGQLLAFVDPKEEIITTAQRAWIKGYLDDFETALYGANYRDPANGYAKYIDVDSFIDHHILVELTKNIDGFRLSTFMFKDRGGKLNMGPLWDYNLSLGNANYLNGWEPTGWYNVQLSDGDYPWWRRLFQDSDFTQRYIDRWTALRRTHFTADTLLGDIDATVQVLSESQVRNYQKWQILGTYVWPNQFIGQTYQEEIDFMTGWLQSRLDWWDSNYVASPSFNQYGGPISPGFALSMAAPAGTIRYTLDGSDPRLRGGGISANSLAYSQPITLSGNTRVFARAKTTAGWSGATDFTFVVTTPSLVITEVMYHPEPPPPESDFSADDFEFLELQNIGSSTLSLPGFHFTEGIDFTFLPGGVTSLAPGEYVVIVKNLQAFLLRYDAAGVKIAGEYAGGLSNLGETLALEGPLNEPILRFNYSDAWYPTTDGGSYSLSIVDPLGPLSGWAVKESWRASSFPDGSPGTDDGVSLGGRQLAGDSNQDGGVDISDAVSFLLRLFLAGSMPLPCEGASMSEGANLTFFDLNGSSAVDVSDVVYLLNYLFRQGPPPAPGKSCIRIAGCPTACGA